MQIFYFYQILLAYLPFQYYLHFIYMKTIPNSLKEARMACRLSQVEVALRLGLESHDRISKWEHGRMYPHMVNLFKLGRLYGKNPYELYPELVGRLWEEIRKNETNKTP